MYKHNSQGIITLDNIAVAFIHGEGNADKLVNLLNSGAKLTYSFDSEGTTHIRDANGQYVASSYQIEHKILK